MLSIILCSHANFSVALLKAAHMIYGVTDKCETVCLHPDGSLDRLTTEIREKYEVLHAEGNDVVCLCDLPHATPYNACCLALADTDARIISGMSLPLLITLISERENVTHEELDTFLQEAVRQSCEMMEFAVIKDLMA